MLAEHSTIFGRSSALLIVDVDLLTSVIFRSVLVSLAKDGCRKLLEPHPALAYDDDISNSNGDDLVRAGGFGGKDREIEEQKGHEKKLGWRF